MPRPAPRRTTRKKSAPAPAPAPRARSASTRGARTHGVYERLRDLIVQGSLAPGSRVIETEIAERLGVSRTPVREALQRLQQEGYVLGGPTPSQARLTVAPLTRDDVRELLHIVGELEGLAARWAAARPEDERRALSEELTDLNDTFRRAASKEPASHGAVYEADERFHRRCVEVSAAPRLLALHDAVKPQAERYIRMYISLLVREVPASVGEHEAIIAAIREGRPDAAQRALQMNWRHAADRLSRVIETAGERGSW